MYKKLICASILVMFIGFQLANSLKCYSCTTPYTCKNPQVVTCSDAAANATRTALLPIYSILPNATGSYECVNVTMSSISLDNPEQWVAGCSYRSIDVCHRVSPGRFSYCRSCYRDLCTKGPAGTFSSSLVTMVSAVVALVFAKMFAST